MSIDICHWPVFTVQYQVSSALFSISSVYRPVFSFLCLECPVQRLVFRNQIQFLDPLFSVHSLAYNALQSTVWKFTSCIEKSIVFRMLNVWLEWSSPHGNCTLLCLSFYITHENCSFLSGLKAFMCQKFVKSYYCLLIEYPSINKRGKSKITLNIPL